MSHLGRYITNSDTDLGTNGASSSNERAVIFPAMPEHGWAYSGSLLCGKTGSSAPTVAIAAWNVFNGTPHNLVGSTNTFAPNNTIVDSSTGQLYTANFPTALQLSAGRQYALGYLSTGAGFGHAMSAAANFADGQGGYTQPVVFYFNDVSSQPPTNPMNFNTSSIEGVISVALNYQANRAPTATLVGPSGFVSTATPALQYRFTDPDAGYGDKLLQYRIQVRRKSDNASFLDTTQTASPSEVSAGQTNWTYNGTALVPGTTYQSRAWVSDQFGTTSAWTGWTDVTVNAGGAVTVTGPSGKQWFNNNYTFGADWTHASNLSTQAVQVQILQNNQVVQDSGAIAKTVVSSASPGTPFTVTWAQAGFAPLTYGTQYAVQIRGQDTGGLWSPYSSPAAAFSTDACPNVPTGLSPANSLAVSGPPPPILTATITDPDDVAPQLTAVARVKSVPAIVNGAFATDVAGWTVSAGDNAGATGVLSWDTSVYPSGAMKIAITASTAAAGNVLLDANTATWIPVVAGENYTLRATHQTDTAGLHPRLHLRWHNAAFALIGVSTEYDWQPAINTTYARVISPAAPAGAVWCHVGLTFNATSANLTGNVYCDAISLDQATRSKPAMTNAGGSTWTSQTTTGTGDVFTVAATGATSGNLALNVDGAVSASTPWNSTAINAQAILQALSTVGAGSLTCTGGPLNVAPIACAWAGTYAGTYKNAPTITSTTIAGATPTVAHTTSGASGDLAAYGTYAWDCAGNDGVLQGAYAPQATFIYGQGPSVTVSSPAANSTVTTATPTVTWSAPGQVKYEIVVYLHNTTTVAYDSGVITSGVQSIAIPGGFLHGSPATAYDVVVSVTNATPLTGSNLAQMVTVSYNAPPTLGNFQASPALAGLDLQPSSVLCSWQPSTYPSGQFVQYLLDRRNAGTSPGDPSTTLLARITSLSQTSYVDYLPVADQAYTYSLRQQVTQGTDVTESGRAEDPASVSLVGIVLCAALDGGTYRAVLSYASSRAYEHHQDTATYVPWGATAPTILTGTQNYQSLAGTFTLVADSAATAASYVAALRAMYAQGLVACVRDERDRRFFGVITKFKEVDSRLATYSAEIEAVECSFSEGILT